MKVALKLKNEPSFADVTCIELEIFTFEHAKFKQSWLLMEGYGGTTYTASFDISYVLSSNWPV